MMDLTKPIHSLYKSKWRKYTGWREDYFKRQYGADWRKQMEKDQKKKAQSIIPQITVSKELCKAFTGELLLRQKSGWDYIQTQLDTGYAKTRASVPEC